MGKEQAPCECGCGQLAGAGKRWLKGHDKRRYPHGTTCSVSGCTRPPEGRGWCHSHFEYWRRNGVVPTSRFLSTPEERFLAKVKKLDAGHWIWTGARQSNRQYGCMGYDGRIQPAHRVAWQIYRGPIPEGLELDHLCRKTLCVNPDHLEPVTPAINTYRSESPSAHNAAKTHCMRGHEFTPENTRAVGKDKRNRACRACEKRPEVIAYRRANRLANEARRKAS